MIAALGGITDAVHAEAFPSALSGKVHRGGACGLRRDVVILRPPGFGPADNRRDTRGGRGCRLHRPDLGRHGGRLRSRCPGGHGLPVEVEVETLQEVDQALQAGVPRILLDNFTTYDIRQAMARIGDRAEVEISGGVTLERIPELATTGARYVSVGALTHSAPAVDISFEMEGAH